MVVHNECDWINKLFKANFDQVKKKMKHVPDFGISSNLSNVNEFIDKLNNFVKNPMGKKYLTNINYKGQYDKNAIVVFEESTNLVVIMQSNGDFITAYKMGYDQVSKMLNEKFIW